MDPTASHKGGRKKGPAKPGARRSGPDAPPAEPTGKGDAREASASPWWKRPPAWSPLVIFMAIGLGFRLWTTLWEPLIYPDSTQYLHLAREIRSGAFFATDYPLDGGFIKSRRLPPLYSFLIAPFSSNLDTVQTWGSSISLLMSLLTFLPLYFTATAVFGRRVAWIAAAVLSFHAFSLLYSSPVLTESTFTFLYLSAIAASVRAFQKPSARAFALCGVVSALLYTTRDVGITAAPLIFAGALLYFRLVRPLPPARIAALVGVLTLSFLLVSSPYFLHIRHRTGKWGLTIQMDNTSITRQIQSVGRDKYERDRIAENETGPSLLGGAPAESIMDLVRISHLLAAKTVRNLGLYGRELYTKWDPLLTAFIVIGVGIMIRDLRRRGTREEKFFPFWVLAWVLQLWALYSFVTPYMVDNRYLYPLMAPGILLAARAADRISEWLANLAGPPAAVSTDPAAIVGVLIPIAASAFFLLTIFLTADFDAFVYYNRDSIRLSYLLHPLAAPLTVCALASLPAAGLVRAWAGSSGKALAVAAGLFAAGVLAVLVFAPDPLAAFPDRDAMNSLLLDQTMRGLLPRYLGAMIAFGLALALIVRDRLYSQAPPWTPARVVFPVIAAAMVFLVQVPDLISVRVRMSQEGLISKYATGHQQVAREIKALGLIPPGKVICSRKPFIAFYLDGKWYLDEKTRDPIPKTPPELLQLAQSGAIDYIVFDSFVTRSLRPLLVQLAIGIEPLPGSRLIYSRYLPEYKRMITVYDCKRPEQPLAWRGSTRAHLLKAREFIDNDALPFAFRELTVALHHDPNNVAAWYYVREILRLYYDMILRPNLKTTIYAPDLLPDLVSAAKHYADLAGAKDPDATAVHLEYKAILDEEQGVEPPSPINGPDQDNE